MLRNSVRHFFCLEYQMKRLALSIHYSINQDHPQPSLFITTSKNSQNSQVLFSTSHPSSDWFKNIFRPLPFSDCSGPPVPPTGRCLWSHSLLHSSDWPKTIPINQWDRPNPHPLVQLTSVCWFFHSKILVFFNENLCTQTPCRLWQVVRYLHSSRPGQHSQSWVHNQLLQIDPRILSDYSHSHVWD